MNPLDTLHYLVAFVAARSNRSEEGAALVEYGLLVGLIAVICVGFVTTLGQNVANMFQTIAGKI
jgi:pilus assembly protein Flp/PilA